MFRLFCMGNAMFKLCIKRFYAYETFFERYITAKKNEVE